MSQLSRQFIYSYFTNYFDNPKMTKIKIVDTFTIYACKIKSLMREHRYIFIFVKDKFLGDTIFLKDAKWEVLQTRAVKDDHQLIPVSYSRKTDDITNSKITVTTKEKDKYIYNSEYFKGLKIQLLYSQNQTRVYQNSGTIGLAIENYNTIVLFE